MQQGELKNTRPWWVGKTQDRDEQEEHKTMQIKWNIKIMMTKRNTRPKWLGEIYQNTTTKRNTLNLNNQKQHQDHSDNKRQECTCRRCSNCSVPSLEMHLTWNHQHNCWREWNTSHLKILRNLYQGVWWIKWFHTHYYWFPSSLNIFFKLKNCQVSWKNRQYLGGYLSFSNFDKCVYISKQGIWFFDNQNYISNNGYLNSRKPQ